MTVSVAFLLGLDLINLTMFLKFDNKMTRERLLLHRNSLEGSFLLSEELSESSEERAKAHRKYLVYREMADKQILDIIATMPTLKDCSEFDTRFSEVEESASAGSVCEDGASALLTSSATTPSSVQFRD